MPGAGGPKSKPAKDAVTEVAQGPVGTAAQAFGVSDLFSDEELSAPPPDSAPFDPGPSSEELAELGEILKGGRDRRNRGRGWSPWAAALVAFAGCFGAVAAYKIFDAPAQPGGPGSPAVSATANSASPETPPSEDPAASPDATAPSSSTDGPSPVPPTSLTSPVGAGGLAKPSAAGKGQPSAARSAKPKAGGDPSDPFGPMVDGPSSDGPSGSGDGGGRGLSSGQVSAVVGANRRSVSRRCLALVRAAQQISAKVSVSITIGASGAVSSISTGGGKNVPGLSSCVAGRVRSWRFPSAGGTTRVSVPFTFIAQ